MAAGLILTVTEKMYIIVMYINNQKESNHGIRFSLLQWGEGDQDGRN